VRPLPKEEVQEVDTLFADEQRNIVLAFLDLLFLDVARARDHGLADYNTMRIAYGLSAVTTFNEKNSKNWRAAPVGLARISAIIWLEGAFSKL
jgi:hypothetical protein